MPATLQEIIRVWCTPRKVAPTRRHKPDGIEIARKIHEHLLFPDETPKVILLQALRNIATPAGVVDVADPVVRAKIRQYNPALSEQSLPDLALASTLGELIRSKEISLEGWNGEGDVPSLLVQPN